MKEIDREIGSDLNREIDREIESDLNSCKRSYKEISNDKV
jgi:hypothetical protein